MKRLLLPLIASLALPAVASAESVWLVIAINSSRKAMDKIEMKDMNQCEEQGAKFISGRLLANGNFLSYECLEGK